MAPLSVCMCLMCCHHNTVPFVFSVVSVFFDNFVYYVYFSDINECMENNGGCEQICNNSQGNVSCSCGEGYVLSENQLTCTGVFIIKFFSFFSVYSFLKYPYISLVQLP